MPVSKITDPICRGGLPPRKLVPKGRVSVLIEQHQISLLCSADFFLHSWPPIFSANLSVIWTLNFKIAPKIRLPRAPY
eukprot:SAG11_NODE_360_length_10188_cov_25.643671_9_plen_78_part_00